MAGKRYKVWVVDLSKTSTFEKYDWPKVYKRRITAAAIWGRGNVRRAVLIVEPPKRRKKNA